MALIQRKNTNFVAISSSMLVMFLLISVGFQPLSAQTDSDGCPTGKRTWPELVGVAGCKAAATIKATNSAYKPVVIPDGTGVPRNFDCTRVFVYISGYQGLVIRTPASG
ncbi:hypothetical protein V2J09_007714 [Rumex salicifolius]